MIFGGGGATGPDLAQGMTNTARIAAHQSGLPVYAIAWVDGAAAGRDITIDLLYNGTTLLQAQIVIPAGSTDPVFVTNFVLNPTQATVFQEAGTLQGSLTQVGSSAPGKSAVVQTYWQPRS